MDGCNNENKGIFYLKTILLIVLFILIVLGSMVLYVHLHPFNISYNEETVDEYITTHKYSDIFNIEGVFADIKIPQNILNTELEAILKEKNTNQHLVINGLSVDINEDIISIDTNLYGINLPLKLSYSKALENNNVIISINKIGLTNRGIRLPYLLKLYIQDQAAFLLEGIVISGEDYFNMDLFSLSSLANENLILKTTLLINQERIIEEINFIKNSRNMELVHYYELYGNEYEKTALYYIDNVEGLSESDIATLLIDIIHEGKIIEPLVLLGESNAISSMISKYGKYMSTLNESELLLQKEDRLYTVIGSYADILYKAFEIYFYNEKMYVNDGQPYSFNKGRIITIKDMVYFYDIDMKRETYERLKFYYSFDEEKLYISYVIDEENVILTDEDGNQNTISFSAYEKMTDYKDKGNVHNQIEANQYGMMTKGILQNLDADSLFLRYIKYDDENLFVVVSPDYNYQEPMAYALEKQSDSYRIIASDIENIMEFNNENQDFNLELVTKEIEDVETIVLNNNMLDVIMRDLAQRGYVEADNELEIMYCSYANNYIAIKLSDSREYVYNIFNMRLYDVKEKNEAIATWKDIPEIILLSNIENDIGVEAVEELDETL